MLHEMATKMKAVIFVSASGPHSCGSQPSISVAGFPCLVEGYAEKAHEGNNNTKGESLLRPLIVSHEVEPAQYHCRVMVTREENTSDQGGGKFTCAGGTK